MSNPKTIELVISKMLIILQRLKTDISITSLLHIDFTLHFNIDFSFISLDAM